MTNRTHLELPEAFAALGLDNTILLALAEIHFREPSEIQKRLIPVALRGVDVIGQARTGTGKTAAFGLPILQRMDHGQAFQTLVVVPTRELAVQVEAELLRFAKHTALRLQVVYGGQKVTHDLKLLERQPHLVVGTPGRIIDLNERGALPLYNLGFSCLSSRCSARCLSQGCTPTKYCIASGLVNVSWFVEVKMRSGLTVCLATSRSISSLMVAETKMV